MDYGLPANSSGSQEATWHDNYLLLNTSINLKKHSYYQAIMWEKHSARSQRCRLTGLLSLLQHYKQQGEILLLTEVVNTTTRAWWNPFYSFPNSIFIYWNSRRIFQTGFRPEVVCARFQSTLGGKTAHDLIHRSHSETARLCILGSKMTYKWFSFFLFYFCQCSRQSPLRLGWTVSERRGGSVWEVMYR